MGFYERLPFTNKHGLNEDWLISKVKECEAKVTEYTEIVNELKAIVDDQEPRITALEESLASVSHDLGQVQETLAEHGRIITSFQGTLESIENRLVIIVNDITTLYANVSRVENESKGRDNSLSARIALLEAATINPITVTQALLNHIPFGNDLRNAPFKDSTQMPYGFWWSESEPASVFSYDPDHGILIGDHHDDTNFIGVTTDCYQLSRNAKYSVTIGVFTSADPKNPAYVLTCDNIAPEYGNYWQSVTGSSSIKVSVQPNGQFWLGYRDADDANMSGKYIGYIKLVESNTAETAVYLNNTQSIYMEAAKNYLTGSYGTETLSTDWFPVVAGSGTESAIDVTFNFAIMGPMLFGQIALVSPYNDDPIGNGVGQVTDIDISSMELPKVAIEGLAGTYADTYTGMCFDVLFTNGADYLDTLTIRHYWPGNIQPQSNGHFASVNFLTYLTE